MAVRNDAKLTPRDRELAALLATGLTEPEAAARLNISRATVTRAKLKAGFRGLVDAIRDETAERVIGSLGEVATEAVATLRALLGSKSESVQLGAVRTALEYLIRGREHADLARRIGELERASEQSAGAVGAPGTGEAVPGDEPGDTGPPGSGPGLGPESGGDEAGPVASGAPESAP